MSILWNPHDQLDILFELDINNEIKKNKYSRRWQIQMRVVICSNAETKLI